MNSQPQKWRWRRGDAPALVRLLVSVVVGGAAAAGIWSERPTAAPLAGWAIGAGLFVMWTWLALWPMDNAETETHASREEPTRLGAFVIVLLAAFVSLIGIVEVLTRKDPILLFIALLSVVASWAAIHTMYATHYARTYYGVSADTQKADAPLIDFHQSESPRYSDFVYVAITVGMSYAISDTDVGSSRLRRTLVFHALLSYFFGTVIVALLINLTANVGS
ncbi:MULTISPECIES: DUF1345 domain-containing protein [Gordonia]|uniref:DUF1345 domain-containing protein n=1 Tax=Gordonia TaxID=2053 RepID=UPI0007EA7465|nr:MULTISPECIES: DUF1345 domain-containing protein [Gordonia]MCM3896113.1 DUF1345 domain-containing protein [Gordonia sputi]OBA61822.1 hypothetical protein A5777_03140 [Gordonia sp. 852002-10350_SCH5691597]